MPDNYKILPVALADFDNWRSLSIELWPEHSVAEMERENQRIFDSLNDIAFVARTDAGESIGFIDLSIRHDYVAGANSSPVAYVEGIYVRSAYRKQGIGEALIRQAEQWGLSKGCTELASDALLGNEMSHQFHQRAGFKEVERVVAFIKTIPS